MLQDFSHSVFLIVAGLFPIINPPGAGFIVLSMMPYASDAERAELARRIAINSFAILVVSLSVGAYVLSFFGISIPVLRVAGGLVVAKAGWDLLQSATHDDDDEPRESAPATEPTLTRSMRARAFYPLTLPITVGPGSISVAIALGTGAPSHGLSVPHGIGVGVALLLLAASIYLCVRFAARIGQLLGTAGTEVAARLFAFVMLCIGVQILWLGVSGLLETLSP